MTLEPGTIVQYNREDDILSVPLLKVYLAAHYPQQAKMRWIRHCLALFGIDVTSRWLDAETAAGDPDPVVWRMCAERDIEDIDVADVFILDTSDQTPTGGREVEAGYSLYIRPFILVGEKRNVFHHLADYTFADWDSCLCWLAKAENRRLLCG